MAWWPTCRPGRTKCCAATSLEQSVRFEDGKDPHALLPELFFLKVSVALEYALWYAAAAGHEARGRGAIL